MRSAVMTDTVSLGGGFGGRGGGTHPPHASASPALHTHVVNAATPTKAPSRRLFVISPS